ncbi:hypothetical protein KKG29_01495 [Patescibacteria group bacterium]|nr:hypothetical protein [Patescibacteria group bacterium]MBU3999837.1 hypothetical protein [Patescibacteria group bacterium]MBU4056671.1 hypothetical protein [Patescibacteria group bacterium]MBU4368142.1 hypothetical protein [Patescibacteria group bacterium]
MALKISFAVNKFFLALAVFGFLALAASALAASGDYVPLVKIPGINPNVGLTAYLSGLYSFLISVVSIFALVMIVYGGMRYITSAGMVVNNGIMMIFYSCFSACQSIFASKAKAWWKNLSPKAF